MCSTLQTLRKENNQYLNVFYISVLVSNGIFWKASLVLFELQTHHLYHFSFSNTHDLCVDLSIQNFLLELVKRNILVLGYPASLHSILIFLCCCYFVCLCMCVCVCVWGGEGEKEREKKRTRENMLLFYLIFFL